MAFSPTLSYAKENERKEERREKKEQVWKNEDNKENKRERKLCVKAFGHLIAPGYMKNKGEKEIDFWKDCVIPFGIMKKMHRNATTTPDTMAPTISEAAILTGTSTLSVSWKTNERATSTLYYSLVTPLNVTASTTGQVSSTTFSKNHLLSLTGLTASSTYYLQIKSADKSGNATSSATFTAGTH